MSTKLGRVLLLCDQALLDMRQLSSKVVTLEQCYVGEGIDGHTGTADLSETEVALIQQVFISTQRMLCSMLPPGEYALNAGRQISTHAVETARSAHNFAAICDCSERQFDLADRIACLCPVQGRCCCKVSVLIRDHQHARLFLGVFAWRMPLPTLGPHLQCLLVQCSRADARVSTMLMAAAGG